jgi:phage gpG-like protein
MPPAYDGDARKLGFDQIWSGTNIEYATNHRGGSRTPPRTTSLLGRRVLGFEPHFPPELLHRILPRAPVHTPATAGQ